MFFISKFELVTENWGELPKLDRPVWYSGGRKTKVPRVLNSETIKVRIKVIS